MRNPDAKHLDFSELIGIIPNNKLWLASNLDMVFERKGKFLVCEWKKENEKVSEGQKYLLKALAKVPCIDVLIVVGDTNDGMKVMQFSILTTQGKLSHRGNTVEEFKQFIRSWYEENN